MQLGTWAKNIVAYEDTLQYHIGHLVSSVKKPSVILGVGIGYGNGINEEMSIFGNNSSYLGIDICKDRILLASEKLRVPITSSVPFIPEKGTHLMHANAVDLPQIVSGPFDAVFVRHPDISNVSWCNVFNALDKVMQSGGLFVATTNADGSGEMKYRNISEHSTLLSLLPSWEIIFAGRNKLLDKSPDYDAGKKRNWIADGYVIVARKP